MMSYKEQLEDIKKQAIEAWTNPAASDKLRELELLREEIMKKIELIKTHPYAIKQQKDGRWISYYKRDGKLRQVHRKTKEEVEEALVKLYLEDEERLPQATVDAIFRAWTADMERRGLGATAVRYIYDYDTYLDGTDLVEKEIRDVKASEIMETLINSVNDNGKTERKYRDLKSILNGIFDYAIAHDIIDINRARQIKRVSGDAFTAGRTKTDAEQIFSEAEQAAFISACIDLYEGHKNPAYLAVILNFLLGLRAGELCTLKLSDFDFERHTLLVQRSEVKCRSIKNGKACSAGTQVVDHLKAGKKCRRIVIDDEATEDFVCYIVSRIEENGQDCSEWLFTRPDGQRITESNIMHAMQNARARCKLTGKTNHNIRKTVITRLIQSRLFSTTEIMRQAGHSSYETTQKYYAFAEDDTDRARRIGKVLNFGIFGIRNNDQNEEKKNPGNP